MFSLLRNRFGIPGVIAVIALVFAMLGGAYAAQSTRHHKKSKVIITKLNQISKGVQTQLKGAAGPPGTQGPAGANGKDGASGKEGAQGKEGLQGLQGIQGEEGSPWPAGGTLPPDATETGAWSVPVKRITFTGTDSGGDTFTSAGVNILSEQISISFPIPLAAPLDDAHTHLFSDADFATFCTGTLENPTAPSGELCIYAFVTGATINSPEAIGLYGGLLTLIPTGTGNINAFGSFAVTG